ncbi:sensor histidine kinase [Filifactor alocis]|uniref:sensor histidine kinase n=1 Tax=Filifactor alocis TaxID=143361 RepID=UPI003F9EC480
MKKQHSLQWKLTFITAFIIIISCLSVSYFISRSAMLFFVEIEESAITMLPQESISDGTNLEIELQPDENFSNVVNNISVEFWIKSLLITLIITLISSSLIFWIIGNALEPLKKFGKQIEEIQAKNLQSPTVSTDGSIEIVRLSNAFNEMLKRLNNTFSAQKQFSANAAHELRTPLAVIRTKLEVFEKSEHFEIRDYMEIITMVRMQTDRLSHVIDLLLEMTELQSAKRSDRIQLAEIVEEVICDLASVGDKKNISLIQKSGDAQIMGNDTLIYRAIYNLVENAIKYNREGGKVTVEVTQNGKFANILISDTGSGINPSDCEHIFEPFFRVDKSRSRDLGGAGLGLALVKEIAQQHGGDVRVVQSSESGTQIELMLLLAKQ